MIDFIDHIPVFIRNLDLLFHAQFSIIALHN